MKDFIPNNTIKAKDEKVIVQGNDWQGRFYERTYTSEENAIKGTKEDKKAGIVKGKLIMKIGQARKIMDSNLEFNFEVECEQCNKKENMKASTEFEAINKFKEKYGKNLKNFKVKLIK